MQTRLDQNRDMLYRAVYEAMAQLVREKIPESGSFRQRGYQIADPEDDMLYTLDVMPSSSEQGKNCCIRMGCITPGTDRLRSNYVFWGSREETIAWFQNEENLNVARETYRNLRARALED